MAIAAAARAVALPGQELAGTGMPPDTNGDRTRLAFEWRDARNPQPAGQPSTHKALYLGAHAWEGFGYSEPGRRVSTIARCLNASLNDAPWARTATREGRGDGNTAKPAAATWHPRCPGNMWLGVAQSRTYRQETGCRKGQNQCSWEGFLAKKP